MSKYIITGVKHQDHLLDKSIDLVSTFYSRYLGRALFVLTAICTIGGNPWIILIQKILGNSLQIINLSKGIYLLYHKVFCWKESIEYTVEYYKLLPLRPMKQYIQKKLKVIS